jgi:hypothetical protein
MNAIQFCEQKDLVEGEWWSNDYDELAKAMEEYAARKVVEVLTQKVKDYSHSHAFKLIEEHFDIAQGFFETLVEIVGEEKARELTGFNPV